MFDKLKKIFENFDEYFDDLRDGIKKQMKRFDEAFKEQKEEFEELAEKYPDKVSEIKIFWKTGMDEPEITIKGNVDEKVIESIKEKYLSYRGKKLENKSDV